MGSNSFGDDAANSLAQALRINTPLSSLDVHSHSSGNILPWSCTTGNTRSGVAQSLRNASDRHNWLSNSAFSFSRPQPETLAALERKYSLSVAFEYHIFPQSLLAGITRTGVVF